MASHSPSKKLRRLSNSHKVAGFNVEIQNAVEEIDSLQRELDKINEDASQEILQLQQKHNHIRTPYLHKRVQIISNIPNFWFTAEVSGDVIKFYFDENPYFENICLTKELHLRKEVPYSRSRTIIWNGQQLGFHHQEVNKSRKRRLKSMNHSFFSWFNNNVDPHTDDIAFIIKDDLWLSPLKYYLVAHSEEEVNGIGGDENNSEI